MSLDNTIMEQITELLGTMGEALEYLSHKESKDLRGLVKDCRARVADALESGLPRPLELQINASKLSDEDWLRAVHLVMQEVAEPFQPKNAFDREFQALLDHIWSHSEGQLLQGMKENLKKIKGLSEETYQNFVNYFARFPFAKNIQKNP